MKYKKDLWDFSGDEGTITLYTKSVHVDAVISMLPYYFIHKQYVSHLPFQSQESEKSAGVFKLTLEVQPVIFRNLTMFQECTWEVE